MAGLLSGADDLNRSPTAVSSTVFPVQGPRLGPFLIRRRKEQIHCNCGEREFSRTFLVRGEGRSAKERLRAGSSPCSRVGRPGSISISRWCMGVPGPEAGASFNSDGGGGAGSGGKGASSGQQACLRPKGQSRQLRIGPRGGVAGCTEAPAAGLGVGVGLSHCCFRAPEPRAAAASSPPCLSRLR